MILILRSIYVINKDISIPSVIKMINFNFACFYISLIKIEIIKKNGNFIANDIILTMSGAYIFDCITISI